MTPSPRSITQLLIEWRNGDQSALDELMPLVHSTLHHMARNYMRGEQPGHTLQATALINELYLRLVNHKGMRWQNRSHFYGVAAQAMRRILVDYARRDRARKRQADLVDLDQAAPVVAKQRTDLMALDEALIELERIDPRKSQVVVMKYFGGMTDDETAEALAISTATVSREWQTAKAKLLQIMSRA